MKNFSTICVHGGEEQTEKRAHITPIYQTTTYTFETAQQAIETFEGKDPSYVYARWGNPTLTQTEEKLALLETYDCGFTAKALLHASGMAALTTLMYSTLKAGDELATHYSLYGGTQELMDKVLSEFDIHIQYFNNHDLESLELLLSQNKKIKLLYLETPANPTLKCIDLKWAIEIAHRYGIKVAVDNTFATPYIQQPMKFGADFVMHSTTKFLNGHGNAMGGVLIGRDLDFMNTKVSKVYKLLGGASNAFEAFILDSGIKTLPLRMDKHCSNALAIAQFLNQHPNVTHVNYLGLENHPYHQVAMRQMKNGGALMSFELNGGLQAAIKFMNQIKLCTHAVSLGTCDTLVSHPASSTHVGVPREHRLKSDITDGLIRMSVGIEDVNDLLEDISRGLS